MRSGRGGVSPTGLDLPGGEGVQACCRSPIEWVAFSPKVSACGNGMDRLDT